MYQTDPLYTLNLHNVKCQLYLNNTGGEDFIEKKYISGETFPYVLYYNCLNKLEMIIVFLI